MCSPSRNAQIARPIIRAAQQRSLLRHTTTQARPRSQHHPGIATMDITLRRAKLSPIKPTRARVVIERSITTTDRAVETISRRATLIGPIQIRDHLCSRVTMLQHQHSCKTRTREASVTRASRTDQAAPQTGTKRQRRPGRKNPPCQSSSNSLRSSSKIVAEASQKLRNEDHQLDRRSSSKTWAPTLQTLVKVAYSRTISWRLPVQFNSNNSQLQ